MRLWIASVEMRAYGRGQVSACREAHHADSRGIDAQFCRTRAHDPDRALAVLERRRMPIGIHTIFQHDAHDTMQVEPLSNIVAFIRHHESAVASARTDYDRRSVDFSQGRQVNRDRGRVGRTIACRSRSAFRPNQLSPRLSRASIRHAHSDPQCDRLVNELGSRAPSREQAVRGAPGPPR